MRPVIFGYVCVPYGCTKRLIAHLTAAVPDYAERECYTLAEVFVDHSDVDRSALAAMIEAIDSGGIHTVVVPSLDHFSSVPGARQAIRRYIEHQTGARVLVMYPSE